MHLRPYQENVQGWTLTKTAQQRPFCSPFFLKARKEGQVRRPSPRAPGCSAEVPTGKYGRAGERGAREPGNDRRAAGAPRGESPLPPVKPGPRGLNEALAAVTASGSRSRSGPGLPAALGLRDPGIVRDDLRPHGPALPQPIRLAHGARAPAAWVPSPLPPARRAEVTNRPRLPPRPRAEVTWAPSLPAAGAGVAARRFSASPS